MSDRPIPPASDDELLDRLAAALVTPPALLGEEPSDAELEALFSALDARFGSEPVGATIVAIPSARSPHRGGGLVRNGRWRAYPFAAAASVAVIAGTAGIAAAGSGNLPRPIRQVAYAVGLPVESPEVADVKQAVKELNKAAEAHDPAAIDAAVAKVRNRLSNVRKSERQRLVSTVNKQLVAVGAPPEPMEPAPVSPPVDVIPPAPTVPTLPLATDPPTVVVPPTPLTTLPAVEPTLPPATSPTEPPETLPPPTQPPDTEPPTTTTTTEPPTTTTTVSDNPQAGPDTTAQG